ncbi:MAG: SpoIIE family protein phosphatase [Ktedonobacteraceae bacterium]|nr:SpoIIE family protein phosphatase [Ktedonobacteraceae bacterium]
MLNVFLNGTPAYLLLTLCFAFLYYGAIIGLELVTHQDPTAPHIIFVTTTLALAIMFDPVRMYVQKYIEQRFNRRNREAARAVQIFTSTLREEIDLDQLSDRFLTVIEQTMDPYSVSLWTRISEERQEKSSATEMMRIADDDPFIAYLLKHAGLLEISRLQLGTSIVQNLKAQQAEILLPLASQGELIGLLVLGPRLKGEDYTAEQRTLLDSLIPQVAPALRVAQLVQDQQMQVRERERIEQELRTARTIQHTFLPRNVPALPGWLLVPYYKSAREVGGDFYDFLPFEDGRLGIVIGDVTDKGIPAALVMTATRTMLRTAALEQSSPSEVLARVNDLLHVDIPAGMFVTCFYAILNPKNGHLRYANAGHEPPYRQHDGNAAELWATGMPLGMMPGTRYDEYEATLIPGESLLFYSDGLVEAHNTTQEMFGFPRLKTALEDPSDGTPLIEVLLGKLKRFTGDGWEQEDDVTLVTLQRTH